MRVMALDLGERRVGVAVSDPSGVVATPRSVVDAAEVRRLGPAFRQLVGEVGPELLLVGLPLTLGGEEGPQASRRLRELGLSERERRGRLDMVAASIFLQAWLDERAR